MTIITAGCFDLIHVGHINLLLFCRQLAGNNGMVYVCIDADEKIRADKREPIFDAYDRFNAIDSLVMYGNKIVTDVFVHRSNDHLEEIIRTWKPDYIVVGSDYKDKPVVGSEQAKVIFFERDNRFSSTKIIEACRKQYIKTIADEYSRTNR